MTHVLGQKKEPCKLAKDTAPLLSYIETKEIFYFTDSFTTNKNLT